MASSKPCGHSPMVFQSIPDAYLWTMQNLDHVVHLVGGKLHPGEGHDFHVTPEGIQLKVWGLLTHDPGSMMSHQAHSDGFISWQYMSLHPPMFEEYARVMAENLVHRLRRNTDAETV